MYTPNVIVVIIGIPYVIKSSDVAAICEYHGNVV